MDAVLEPIIMYKLDEETGEIHKVHIHNYEEGKFTSNKRFYRYKLNGYTNYIYNNDFDRVKNWRYYSFHNNDDVAYSAFLEFVKGRQTKAIKEAKRWYRVSKRMEAKR